VTKMDRLFYYVLHKFRRLPGTEGSVSPAPLTSVSTSVTTLGTRQYESRRPMSERDLMGRVPIATSVSIPPPAAQAIHTMPRCPACGTFKKSGRKSCCAPGGAWFKNCGGAHNNNVDHSWLEGVAACKHPTTSAVPMCPTCGTITKSGKTSCCGHGGSWFRKCGNAGNKQFRYTWYKGIEACKAPSDFKKSITHQLYFAQQESIDASRVAITTSNRAFLAAAFTFSSVNTSTSMSDMGQIATSIYALDPNASSSTSEHRAILKDYLASLMSVTHKSVGVTSTTQGFIDLLKSWFIPFLCLSLYYV